MFKYMCIKQNKKLKLIHNSKFHLLICLSNNVPVSATILIISGSNTVSMSKCLSLYSCDYL